jgi:hypothetical protein
MWEAAGPSETSTGLPTKLYGVTAQKTVTVICTAVTTPWLTYDVVPNYYKGLEDHKGDLDN